MIGWPEVIAERDNIQYLANRADAQSGIVQMDDIEVDVERFQYKQGVDDKGRQAGNPLDNVEKWNPDFEGVIDVWEDPEDGKTYVVNGHNRLAKAKQHGHHQPAGVNINTARTAEQAKCAWSGDKHRCWQRYCV